ncbi:MAG: glycosyltransferase family 4 protein [Lachnospiraceae bacterium]|nr:glycosyltransferase family 4 protein [Lachnospiraceae bacterium]
MHKILWICNIMLPAIGRELNMPYSNREGWLSGIFERVRREEAPFTLGVCFPAESGAVRKFLMGGVSCYPFAENLNTPEIYDAGMEEAFQEIFRDFQPDMIHIFGTEFPHALAAARAFGKPERTLIGIQGLCGEIAKVYMAGLPEAVRRKVTFRDFIRKDSIREQQEKFIRRGENEAEAIRNCGNITGRTRFDREGSARINPGARYYPMNETLREAFYEGEWHLGKCEPHSIFLGQGDYPLKGMHFVLEAMALLAGKYPDCKLYVAGNSVISHRTLKEKLKLPAYGKYLLSLIKRYGLEERVVMLGKLSGEEMKARYLKSSVFVCASVLENSPNTVGEAQLLGVPVAASMAGGIPDMITDGEDGLLFPAGDAAKLAEAIERLWDTGTDENGLCLAERISGKARKRAREVHNGETNYRRLLRIYEEIIP